MAGNLAAISAIRPVETRTAEITIRPAARIPARTGLRNDLFTNPRHHVEANAPEGSYVVRSPTSDIGTKR